MIKTTLIGHLGKDATMNNVNQKTVINFTVAHTEKWKDSQGQDQSKTLWVDCSYWTEKTGIHQYLTKGTQVYLEGVPDVRSYQTADGKQGASLVLKVLNVQLLGSPQAQPMTQAYTPQYAPQPQQQGQYGQQPQYPAAVAQPQPHPSFVPQPQQPYQGQQPAQQPQRQQQLQPVYAPQPAQPVYDPNNNVLPF